MKRKLFQGIFNVVRFNIHFYVVSFIILVTLLLTVKKLPVIFQVPVIVGICFALITIFISLAVSFYVYDISDLYTFKWLDTLSKSKTKHILNVNAGFDETSHIIFTKFPEAKLTICDFYDAEKHTEISIKRARKAYPPVENTVSVNGNHLPFADETFDAVLAILSAHEIRNANERDQFFAELNRVIKSNGQIFITEHLRDSINFLAYSIGAFHFHTRKSWIKSFSNSNLIIIEEIESTPFITTFVLEKNGITH